jgi:arylsulfatase A-like enzyme
MMTGLGVLEHGVRENGTFVLDDSALTLAEVLSAKRYQTVAFVSAFVLDHQFGIAQGFEHYDDDLGGGAAGSRKWQGHEVEHWERPADVTTDSAIAWVQDNVDAKSPKPFFMWVHYYDPHKPWAPPEPYRSLYKHAYDGEIAHMDTQLGRLIAELKRMDLLDTTLVVVASDHGENLGEHGVRGHGWDIYENAMRTVLMMRLPGTLPAGKRPAPRVLSASIAPTILDLLGIHDSGLPGQSLRPLWSGEGSYVSPDPVYMETLLPALRADRPEVVGVLEGRFKLVARPKSNQFKLFDVQEDPGEQKDLAAQMPTKLADLKNELAKVAAGAAKDSHAKPVQMDEKTTRMLEALGYIVSGE